MELFLEEAARMKESTAVSRGLRKRLETDLYGIATWAAVYESARVSHAHLLSGLDALRTRKKAVITDTHTRQ